MRNLRRLDHPRRQRAAILGGKPGSVPMPLRMGHFAVVDGELEREAIGLLAREFWLGNGELEARIRG